MSAQLPGWMAYDMRTMLEGYFERGFTSTEHDVSRFTKLLGHAPTTYEDFVHESEETRAQDRLVEPRSEPWLLRVQKG